MEREGKSTRSIRMSEEVLQVKLKVGAVQAVFCTRDVLYKGCSVQGVSCVSKVSDGLYGERGRCRVGENRPGCEPS